MRISCDGLNLDYAFQPRSKTSGFRNMITRTFDREAYEALMREKLRKEREALRPKVEERHGIQLKPEEEAQKAVPMVPLEGPSRPRLSTEQQKQIGQLNKRIRWIDQVLFGLKNKSNIFDKIWPSDYRRQYDAWSSAIRYYDSIILACERISHNNNKFIKQSVTRKPSQEEFRFKLIKFLPEKDREAFITNKNMPIDVRLQNLWNIKYGPPLIRRLDEIKEQCVKQIKDITQGLAESETPADTAEPVVDPSGNRLDTKPVS